MARIISAAGATALALRCRSHIDDSGAAAPTSPWAARIWIMDGDKRGTRFINK
jgi:hypothetical protein